MKRWVVEVLTKTIKVSAAISLAVIYMTSILVVLVKLSSIASTSGSGVSFIVYISLLIIMLSASYSIVTTKRVRSDSRDDVDHY